jgi:menaquinone-dependent protoporphyrinogen oxidase
MMKVLVTPATKHRATAEIAAAIGEALGGEHGLDATVVPPEQVVTVDGYDAVVLGSAVYAGHWLAPAKELVDRAAGALAGKPVWLFSSGPVGDPPKPEEDPVDVAEILATARPAHSLWSGA